MSVKTIIWGNASHEVMQENAHPTAFLKFYCHDVALAPWVEIIHLPKYKDVDWAFERVADICFQARKRNGMVTFTNSIDPRLFSSYWLDKVEIHNAKLCLGVVEYNA